MAPPSTDRTAFEELLAPLLEQAFCVARNLTRNTSDAEDLVQEAALSAFRGFSSFQEGTNFRAWFYKILLNCHYGRHRQASRRPATLELDSAPDLYLYMATAEAGLHGSCEDPAQAVMRKLTREQVLRAVDNLPEDFRLVARLHFVEEMRYEEISEILGCPVGTVRSRLHRGRKMLQKLLWNLAVAAGIVPQSAPPLAPSLRPAI